MEMKIYKLKSEKIKGHIYAAYKNNEFYYLEVNSEPLTPVQFTWLMEHLPHTLLEVPNSKLKLEELKPRNVQDKLILFNIFYKKYRGTAYLAKKNEKANLSSVPLNENLLKTFFESQAWWVGGNYTISNYIKRINNIKDAAMNPVSEKKTVHPDFYDKEYERKLPLGLVNEYHKHLRALGFKVKYSPAAGSVWQKE